MIQPLNCPKPWHSASRSPRRRHPSSQTAVLGPHALIGRVPAMALALADELLMAGEALRRGPRADAARGLQYRAFDETTLADAMALVGAASVPQLPSCFDAPARRNPSRSRSLISPVGGRFSSFAMENSGTTQKSIVHAPFAASTSPCIANGAVRKKWPRASPRLRKGCARRTAGLARVASEPPLQQFD